MAVNSFNAQNPPVTTKGDLFTFSTIPTRLGVGANDTVLTADSSTATGLKWAAPSSGGMTLINTGGTTLSGASVTISSIPTTYVSLIVFIRSFKPATDGSSCYMRFNGDSNTRYNYGTSDTSNVTFAQDFISVVKDASNTANNGITQIEIPDYANTTTWKQCHVYGHTQNFTTTTNYNRGWNYGFYNQTPAITSLTFYASSGNMTSGTVLVYGVK